MLKIHRRLMRFHNHIRALPVFLRCTFGILLILGGMLGFFPILGFWMIPLGLLVLSVDFRWARKGYLSMILWLRKRHRHQRSISPGTNNH